MGALDRTRRSTRPWLRGYALQLPAAAAAAALALPTTLPHADLAKPDTYHASPAATAAKRLLAGIPDGPSVEANRGPISLLTFHCRVFWIGNTHKIAPQFIALDTTTGTIRDPMRYAKQLHPQAAYTQVDSAGGYVLLRRS